MEGSILKKFITIFIIVIVGVLLAYGLSKVFEGKEEKEAQLRLEGYNKHKIDMWNEFVANSYIVLEIPDENGEIIQTLYLLRFDPDNLPQ